MSSIVVLWRTIWPDGGAADNWMESTPIMSRGWLPRARPAFWFAAGNEADVATVTGRD